MLRLNFRCLACVVSIMASAAVMGSGPNVLSLRLVRTAVVLSPPAQTKSAVISKQVQNEILAAMKGQITAMNAEKVDSYMAAIHPDSPLFTGTKSMMGQLFEQYDLNVTLNSCKVVSLKGNTAFARTTITTKKLKGPQFQNNRVVALQELRKVKGKWLTYGTKLEKFDYL